MKKSRLILLPVVMLLWGGCNSKQYYTPAATTSVGSSSSHQLISFSRDGASMEGGIALNAKQELPLKLEPGYSFINNTADTAITADKKGACQLHRVQGGTQTIQLPNALVAATTIGNQLVYLLQDNSYGIYDLDQKSIIYTNSSKKVFSIDTRIANPMWVDNLVVIPTLDGKLVILDLKTHKVLNQIYVTTNSTLNNVIFLRRLGNTLVAATPHGVMIKNNQGRRDYKQEISEVAIDDAYIYTFTKDGMIVKLDPVLKVVAEQKYKFAHFSTAGVYSDKVFALDKQGYLIISNKNLTKHKDYKLSEVEGYSFSSTGKLYYNGQVVDIASLTYE